MRVVDDDRPEILGRHVGRDGQFVGLIALQKDAIGIPIGRRVLRADAGDFQDGKESKYLHDGNTATPSAKPAAYYFVVYDFGAEYTLSSASIFGDAGGNWYSTTWTLLYWDGSDYQLAFRTEECNGNQWFTEPVNVTTSKVKIRVNGSAAGILGQQDSRRRALAPLASLRIHKLGWLEPEIRRFPPVPLYAALGPEGAG